MNFVKSCKLINNADVLTQTDKSRLISISRTKDLALFSILEAYESSQDQEALYDSLMSKGFMNDVPKSTKVIFSLINLEL